jgi:hypothetical protein
LKLFYNSIIKAKEFNSYKDENSRKENYERICEYEKKVENKKKEIEKYMNKIDEKSNLIIGFSPTR